MSFLQIDARSMIYNMYDLLVGKTYYNQKNRHVDGEGMRCTARGLLFSLDVTVRDPRKKHEESYVSRNVHVLVAGNHKAFVSHSQDNPVYQRTPVVWENVGNHDSCWIESVDTELTKVYFDMCKELSPEKAPRALEQTGRINVFSGMCLVEVEIVPDKARNAEQGSAYWYTVENLKKIEKAEFDAYIPVAEKEST